MLFLLPACVVTIEQDDHPLGHEDSPVVETGDSGQAMFNATLEGTVSVLLTHAGDDGSIEVVPWAESSCGDEYSFGWIFITAYEEDDSADGRHYLGEKVIKAPTTGENEFSLDIRKRGEGPVTVFATVDYWGDRVIGTDDYSSSYQDDVHVLTDGLHSDVDISVFVPECYPGGGSCPTASVSGDITITTSYADGEAVAMLVDMDGKGPYHEAWTWPQEAGGGAEGEYSITTCSGLGEMRLIAAWDSNGNEMADPLDRWGAYAPEPDVDGNPITIGDSALTNMTIQVPLGDDAGISVVPFVTWNGSLSVLGGNFDDLASGTSVHVVALKTRPDQDLVVADFESDAYDMQTFSWDELSGQDSVDYSLHVPANSLAYLWAFADEDGDGNVNEPGEHVGRGGEHSTGKLPTGTSSTEGLDLQLSSPQ